MVTSTTSLPAKTRRVSLSLPEPLVHEITRHMLRRGFQSRSQAVSEMLHRTLDQFTADDTAAIVTAVISVVYNVVKNDCQIKISQLQREYIDEVISSLHVQLELNHSLEVMIAQGPAGTIQKITDQMASIKGVQTANLTISRVIMPPVHTRSE